MIPASKELKEMNKKLNEIGRDLASSVREIPDRLTRELAKGAIAIRGEIIESMTKTPKTGRHYRRGKSGNFHIASSPGNPPARDFGELIKSITFEARNMEVEVGSAGGAPYSVFLEEGTPTMAARPFLDPAVKKHEKSILDKVGDIAFQIIQGGFK